METLDDRVTADSIRGRHPVALIVFCAGHPAFTWLAVGERPLRIGRDTHPGLELDARMSREHVELEWHGGRLVKQLGVVRTEGDGDDDQGD